LVQQDFDAVFTAKHPLAAQGADKIAKENRLAGTVNTSATYASRGDFLVELLIKSDSRGGDEGPRDGVWAARC
jgi:hypothetical protein